MNLNKKLILFNGKDKSLNVAEVTSCKYNKEKNEYVVIFRGSNKPYYYNPQSIKIITHSYTIDPKAICINSQGKNLFNIKSILAFCTNDEKYYRIKFECGNEKIYDEQKIVITNSILAKEESTNFLSYIRRVFDIIIECNKEKNSEEGSPKKGKEDPTPQLREQYEELTCVGDDTAMAPYLVPKEYKPHEYNESRTLIFPFGGNASQFKAVKNAFQNQISVIQGPPGTGKTQTILNIIANLLVDGKTMQIVSNNNSAIQNVLDKLKSDEYNLDFLAAFLGKDENKKNFCEEQTGEYPNLIKWSHSKEEQEKLLEKIKTRSDELSDIFSKQEDIAKYKQELDSLRLEKEHFDKFCKDRNFQVPTKILQNNLKSEDIISLWQDVQALAEKNKSISLWFKIKSLLFYKVADWSLYQNNMSSIIMTLQCWFYQTKEHELSINISRLEEFLKNCNPKNEMMNDLKKWSIDYLHAKIYERYGGLARNRKKFDTTDMWKSGNDFVLEYPIILSTTFSARKSLTNVTYDYIIMDEASQVGIDTGVLSLSCARNAVIVGDEKQLSHIITNGEKKIAAIFKEYNLPDGYDYSKYSFLESVCEIIPKVPKALLREHYRCHPKVIGFCNQKFYNNELIIMTEDKGEKDAIALVKTVEGNHCRDHINQRQIDVADNDVLQKMLCDTPREDIGFISPYRDQVEEIKVNIGNDKIESSTVHKFQGQEKDTIVFTTVDDIVTNFSDDPDLLNVAISRAKKQFILIASSMEQPSGSNIRDLIDYIQYNNNGKVVQSEISSVFDLLYKQYTDARIAFLKKHLKVSEYDSENLMYGAIIDLLNNKYSEYKMPENLSLDVNCHYPLHELLQDTQKLNELQRQYAMNPATHIDFLIYNKVSKRPVLAIEVDGFHFHKKSTEQFERDKMKDIILNLYNIPFKRFKTNGSGEIEQIAQAIENYSKNKIIKNGS